jgi:hypothetical protein
MLVVKVIIEKYHPSIIQKPTNQPINQAKPGRLIWSNQSLSFEKEGCKLEVLMMDWRRKTQRSKEGKGEMNHRVVRVSCVVCRIFPKAWRFVKFRGGEAAR